jgi:predicted MFS family arabinose efflux permease
MFRSYYTHYKELSSNVKLFLAGNAIQGVGLSIYTLLFNLYLKELGYGESSIGNLISTTSLGISLMAIPAALIIEKFHVKHLVITGLLLSSLLYCSQILHTDVQTLFVFGLLASMFQALFNISISPFYLRNSTPKIRMHLFTINSALNMCAHFVGYLAGGFLPDLMKWYDPSLSNVTVYRSSIIAALGIVFLSNLLFIRIRRVPIPKAKKHLFEGLREKDWKILSKLIIPKLCFAFGGGLIVPFMNLYLKERFNLSTEMIGVSYATLQVFIFMGIFVTPWIVKRTTNLKFILFTSLLSIPFMLTMGLTGNIVLVMSCFFMRGMLMNMSSPITSMFEMEHVSEKECVFASAMILFFYHLVYMTSTRLGGYLIETYSFGPTFYIAAVSYATAIILYHRFFKQEDVLKEDKKPEELKISAAA